MTLADGSQAEEGQPAGDATWTPNLTWITDTLAVGGRFPAERVAELANGMRVAAIVDLRREDRDDATLLERHGIAFLHLPTDDHGALAPATIAAGTAFAHRFLDAERRVLVHCEHGIGRSATLALCIMVERGMPPMEALALAKDRRALVSPSPAQFHCWVEWLRGVREAGRHVWALPEFDAFCAIAYRHLHHEGRTG